MAPSRSKYRTWATSEVSYGYVMPEGSEAGLAAGERALDRGTWVGWVIEVQEGVGEGARGKMEVLCAF